MRNSHTFTLRTVLQDLFVSLTSPEFLVGVAVEVRFLRRECTSKIEEMEIVLLFDFQPKYEIFEILFRQRDLISSKL